MPKSPLQTPPSPLTVMSRRTFALGLPLLATGCMGGGYGSMRDGGFNIPAVDAVARDPSLMRQQVRWNGNQKPGTIVINVPERRLYLVEGGGRAIRYGVGVGRSEGVNFRGAATVGRKEKWPHWTPTANMMAEIPLYRSYAGGMEGGPNNPLGPRALYLYKNGRDTYFRLHGTTEPETIGSAVSSGCIRLFNQDIIDLYDRVGVGTRVEVVQA